MKPDTEFSRKEQEALTSLKAQEVASRTIIEAHTGLVIVYVYTSESGKTK